jgi:hypothetical protein
MRGRLVVQRYTHGHHQTTAGAKDTPDFPERLDQVRREEVRVTAPRAVDRTVLQPGGGQITPLEPGSKPGQQTHGALPGDPEAGFGEIHSHEVASGPLGQPQTGPALPARQIEQQPTRPEVEHGDCLIEVPPGDERVRQQSRNR